MSTTLSVSTYWQGVLVSAQATQAVIPVHMLKIIEACREQGVEEPTWRRAGGFVYVTFKRPNKSSLEGHVAQNNTNVAQSTGNVAQNGQGSPEFQKSSSENQNSSPEILASTPEFTNSSSETKVLTLLKSYPSLTLEKVASLIKMTKRGVIKITNRLQETGRLSRKGANKNGEWIVNE